MQNTTSIEVKCECKIPFHSELVWFLNNLINGPTGNYPTQEIPHKEDIRLALKSKVLFISVHPVKKLRPKLLATVKTMLKKDVIGTITVGADEITLILI